MELEDAVLQLVSAFTAAYSPGPNHGFTGDPPHGQQGRGAGGDFVSWCQGPGGGDGALCQMPDW